jgi:phosphopantothenoylcysteine decarboxylase/phosphopantothenate--cysteine ligase
MTGMTSAALSGRKILLIVGGGIAAYKALELTRLLKKAGCEVMSVLTSAGAEFVTPMSLAALTGHPVRQALFMPEDETAMGHIELSRWADLVVVAPATAGLIAKAANGLADDLASTTLLATDKRVLLAPAMNVRMWLHPAVQANVERLRASTASTAWRWSVPTRARWPAASSDPAGWPSRRRSCRRSGPAGRARRASAGGPQGVVTAGPTFEPIDPVRGLTNRSSGKQGYAIAEALAQLGAQVTLVSGPVALAAPVGVERVWVETAREMKDAVEAALPADIAVMSAAVADWRVDGVASGKIKKAPGGPPSLALIENPDILASVSAPGKRVRNWWSASRPRRRIWRPTPGPSCRARAATGSSATTCPTTSSAPTATP